MLARVSGYGQDPHFGLTRFKREARLKAPPAKPRHSKACPYCVYCQQPVPLPPKGMPAQIGRIKASASAAALREEVIGVIRHLQTLAKKPRAAILGMQQLSAELKKSNGSTTPETLMNARRRAVAIIQGVHQTRDHLFPRSETVHLKGSPRASASFDYIAKFNAGCSCSRCNLLKQDVKFIEMLEQARTAGTDQRRQLIHGPAMNLVQVFSHNPKGRLWRDHGAIELVTKLLFMATHSVQPEGNIPRFQTQHELLISTLRENRSFDRLFTGPNRHQTKQRLSRLNAKDVPEPAKPILQCLLLACA